MVWSFAPAPPVWTATVGRPPPVAVGFEPVVGVPRPATVMTRSVAGTPMPDVSAVEASKVTVYGNPVDPSAQLLAGWLQSRLDFDVAVEKAEGKYISSVSIEFGDGHTIDMRNEGYKLVMSRPNQMDSIAPFPSRSTGDLLAEELRRLDADATYAEALGAVTGQRDLSSRPATRTHIWHDPALAGEG